MKRRRLSTLPGFITLILVLAASSSPVSGEPAAAREIQQLVLSTPKAGRERPLVAVLADNAGSETTDFMVPYGVLAESGVVDVVTVSTGPGSVHLHPALTVRLEQTTRQFDARQPEGADIVIVPAMHHPDDPVVLQWIQQQYEAGATIVGICDGVWSLAHAGLLDGKSATGHWYSLARLDRRHPDTTWIRDRRYVVDDRVVTTTGVSASIPVSLALVEAVAGTEAALALGARLGISDFGAEHDSNAFRLSAMLKMTAGTNWLAFWNRETITLPVDDGVDEIALALTADAWSRTFRSSAVTAHMGRDSVRSRRGLVIEVDNRDTAGGYTPSLNAGPPGASLDDALESIAARYGRRTAEFVAVQLEYQM